MAVFELLVAAYLIVSIIALIMTYREQAKIGLSRPLQCLIGFAACTLWPLPLLAMLANKAIRMTVQRF